MRRQIEASAAAGLEEIMMRSQYALATSGRGAARVQTHLPSAGLGTIVMLAALSPIFAVCGFMLAQILGFVPY